MHTYFPLVEKKFYEIHLLPGKGTTLGSFCKLFTKRGLFSNYLPGGSVFICIAPKARVQFNGELTCGIELLC